MQQRRNDTAPVVVFDLLDLCVPLTHTPPLQAVDVPRPAPVVATGSLGAEPRATPDYFVPRDLARRWSICVDKVLRFIQTGELRAFNVASKESRRPRYRISIEEVRRFEEQTRSAAPPRAETNTSPRRRKSSSARRSSRSYF
jgi:hypothetical protein